jgi:hypothetical protein
MEQLEEERVFFFVRSIVVRNGEACGLQTRNVS